MLYKRDDEILIESFSSMKKHRTLSFAFAFAIDLTLVSKKGKPNLASDPNCTGRFSTLQGTPDLLEMKTWCLIFIPKAHNFNIRRRFILIGGCFVFPYYTFNFNFLLIVQDFTPSYENPGTLFYLLGSSHGSPF